MHVHIKGSRHIVVVKSSQEHEFLSWKLMDTRTAFNSYQASRVLLCPLANTLLGRLCIVYDTKGTILQPYNAQC